jgi:hypothetical protein
MNTDDEHNLEITLQSQNMKYKYDNIPPVHKTSAQFVFYHKLYALRKWVPLPSRQDKQFSFFSSK